MPLFEAVVFDNLNWEEEANVATITNVQEKRDNDGRMVFFPKVVVASTGWNPLDAGVHFMKVADIVHHPTEKDSYLELALVAGQLDLRAIRDASSFSMTMAELSQLAIKSKAFSEEYTEDMGTIDTFGIGFNTHTREMFVSYNGTFKRIGVYPSSKSPLVPHIWLYGVRSARVTFSNFEALNSRPSFPLMDLSFDTKWNSAMTGHLVLVLRGTSAEQAEAKVRFEAMVPTLNQIVGLQTFLLDSAPESSLDISAFHTSVLVLEWENHLNGEWHAVTTEEFIDIPQVLQLFRKKCEKDTFVESYSDYLTNESMRTIKQMVQHREETTPLTIVEEKITEFRKWMDENFAVTSEASGLIAASCSHLKFERRYAKLQRAAATNKVQHSIQILQSAKAIEAVRNAEEICKTAIKSTEVSNQANQSKLEALNTIKLLRATKTLRSIKSLEEAKTFVVSSTKSLQEAEEEERKAMAEVEQHPSPKALVAEKLGKLYSQLESLKQQLDAEAAITLQRIQAREEENARKAKAESEAADEDEEVDLR